MARNFTIQWEAPEVTLPTSAFAEFTTQNNRPVNAFDAGADESIILEGVVPAEFTGAGTLKLRLLAMANTTSASDKARVDVVTEFRTPGAGESGNTDNFDGTADSGTLTFSTTAYEVRALAITLTPATAPAAGDKFRVKVMRDANHASDDTLAVDLLVMAYELYEETV
jgi:hypothetical protein